MPALAAPYVGWRHGEKTLLCYGVSNAAAMVRPGWKATAKLAMRVRSPSGQDRMDFQSIPAATFCPNCTRSPILLVSAKLISSDICQSNRFMRPGQ
jgi:hypothetical protein